ncbi:uncharacterized protein LOC131841452 [Achroia grisella]|uniref:uncharacterized protein LOC131841452 n=1 Tax=Achroia grisella TaxID=688607 RepID=UPI0027D274C4|nr:uncharacterized protein LOC131841452 [Achroia grisella]
MLMFFILLLSELGNVLCIKYDNKFHYDLYETTKLSGKNNLNETFFSSLESYQVDAQPVSEVQYPWVAKVIHSRSKHKPHMCTAVCIEKRIFITAARCIYSLKVKHTTVIYQQERLPALSFVVPSQGTKQAFDDIGFIVVEDGFTGIWKTIKLFESTNRTDDNFEWFVNLGLSGMGFKVVGYATQKGIHRIKAAEREFDLTELEIKIDIKICTTILTFNNRVNGFHVPCYHSCTLEQFKTNNKLCQKYHGVEGGAIIDIKTHKLLGVATWGPYFYKYELPVGFSVPNSDNFFKDYTCARHIRNDNSVLVMAGYYQSICDDI